MSYQVIARKWRPQAFDEVTGQDHITRTLRNAIDHDRLHHSYLFSGARGVGKTTTARLLAKALNCHRTEKPNSAPCRGSDLCPSCLEISESRSIDVLEFDAASNTQVDKIREIILENINVAAARDRYKIFIIDEVHMLSNSSFNALLKTIEEPPPNVVFIMATTELHKVPDTIRSRSQEFVFRTIPQSQIFDRLKLIADADNIKVDDPALQIIARSGEGSMRDAQSNFDQVISFSGDKITVDDVSMALGLASGEVINKLVGALAGGEPKTALEIVDGLVSSGQDLRAFCRDCLAVIRDIMIFKVSGDASLVESSSLSAEAIRSAAEKFTEADLVRFFNSLAETETSLKEAVQGRYLLEIGLLKLIEMRRVKPIEDILRFLAKGDLSQATVSPESSDETPMAAAAPEKKTLNNDNGDAYMPTFDDLGISETAEDDVPYAETAFDQTGADVFDEEPVNALDASGPVRISTSPEFINALPVKLSPISSEDLEHFEDKRLDDEFERKLEIVGDDTLPINGAAEFAALAKGNGRSELSAAAAVGSALSSGRRPLNIEIPTFESEETGEVPVLPKDPTEADLFAYANAHPSVRRVMRIFKTKVIGVGLK